MFEASGLSVTRSDRPILQDVSLRLASGSLIVVVGPNGAGKTTLMRALAGDMAPSAGTVTLDGQAISQWPSHKLATRRAVLPQASHLAFPFTVYEVVALGLPAGAPRTRPLDVLARVGLQDHAGRYYQQLSGGEQQRVHLARVLCQIGAPVAGGAPRWLFLDEPTSNLDIRHQFSILDIARAHVRAGGGALAILHDLNMASLYADRLIVVSRGEIASDGPPRRILTDSLLHEVFGIGLKVDCAPPGAPPFVLPHSVHPRSTMAQAGSGN